MALASPRPQALQQLLPFLRDQGFEGELNRLDLLYPEGVIPWGGLFLPDPSIGRWAMEAARWGFGVFAHWPNSYPVDSRCALSSARPSE